MILSCFDSTICTKDVIRNNEIFINNDIWKELNLRNEKENIKTFLSEAISTIDLPVSKISQQEAIDDFNKLKNFNSLSLFKNGKVFTRYDYLYQLSDYYIDINPIGNKSSNFFHQENRYKCDSINSPSPFRTWNVDKFRMSMLGALWTLKFEEVNTHNLHTCIALRKYIASQYRVSAALAIYDKFKARRVLDFSAGWGDRLSAFCASKYTERYWATDPNKNLQVGYNNQNKLFGQGKQIDIFDKPAEDIEFPNEIFDLVFTSPPYFTIERYTQDHYQSWKRYKKIDIWLNSFLFPVINKSWNCLDIGGYLVINISDVYAFHQINHICDPMNLFISNLPNSKYCGTIGLRLPKRVNSGAIFGKEGIFVEPIWIWKKE